ncbi:MAG: hypothetical protein GY797_10265 [Deltaproteobacteria bacterium]|nr:hypothetical protein [Deltaproteobacteria bacterium]
MTQNKGTQSTIYNISSHLDNQTHLLSPLYRNLCIKSDLLKKLSKQRGVRELFSEFSDASLIIKREELGSFKIMTHLMQKKSIQNTIHKISHLYNQIRLFSSTYRNLYFKSRLMQRLSYQGPGKFSSAFSVPSMAIKIIEWATRMKEIPMLLLGNSMTPKFIDTERDKQVGTTDYQRGGLNLIPTMSNKNAHRPSTIEGQHHQSSISYVYANKEQDIISTLKTCRQFEEKEMVERIQHQIKEESKQIEKKISSLIDSPEVITDQVYTHLTRRLQLEKERLGRY